MSQKPSVAQSHHIVPWVLTADTKQEGYVAARSNEFGFANYELIPAPVFLGTEVKDPVIPTGPVTNPDQ